MKKLKWEEAKIELQKEELTFLEFSTAWCGDCHMMAPVVSNLENSFKEQGISINFIEVDAEEANLLRKTEVYNVSKVPAFYVVKGSKKELIGFEYQPLEMLESKIKDFIKVA